MSLHSESTVKKDEGGGFPHEATNLLRTFSAETLRKAMLTVRRGRRRAEVLLTEAQQRMSQQQQPARAEGEGGTEAAAASAGVKASTPMGAWGSFLFLSNLITGPGACPHEQSRAFLLQFQ